ncbi:hypothetical protein HUJ04_006994 [Dendroctonus ponderosae]|nr:hypothetical protein HUJ04_006994 [Dendroctonus ponderosae]
MASLPGLSAACFFPSVLSPYPRVSAAYFSQTWVFQTVPSKHQIPAMSELSKETGSVFGSQTPSTKTTTSTENNIGLDPHMDIADIHNEIRDLGFSPEQTRFLSWKLQKSSPPSQAQNPPTQLVILNPQLRQLLLLSDQEIKANISKIAALISQNPAP